MIRSGTARIFVFSFLAFALGCSDDHKPDKNLPSLPQVSGVKLQEFVSTSELPVLVEFGVDFRCERCRQMQESVCELEERFRERAKIVRVDFNANGALVSQFGGTICPTYVFFQNGKPIRTESFPVSADILESYLDSMVASASPGAIENPTSAP